jgi:hypothetical protein
VRLDSKFNVMLGDKTITKRSHGASNLAQFSRCHHNIQRVIMNKINVEAIV